MTDYSVIASGKFRRAPEMPLADNLPTMAGKKNNLDAARRRLLGAAEAQGVSLNALSEHLGKNRSYLENYVRKGSPRALAYEDRIALAKRLGISQDELTVDLHNHVHSKQSLERPPEPGVAFLGGDTRAGAAFKAVTDQGPIIGRVQAGAWMEADQTPEREWKFMPLPDDDRFPGIKRYVFENIGESMNRVCPDGGRWVTVLFEHLGQEPAVGQYVIAQRIRTDGLAEWTAKLLKIGPDGKHWLYPDSTDPAFKPFPVAGGPDIEEVRIIARCTLPIGRKL